MIDSLYDRYHQKSKTFLYPLLGIPKKSPLQPTQTYIEWDNKINRTEYKLILSYKEADQKLFDRYSKLWIYNSPLLILQEHPYYIFDLSDFKQDWNSFLVGKYSQISQETKKRILKYYETYREWHYIHSFLYPENYFHHYSKLLNMDIEDIMVSGQLCDKPNLKKEILFL